MVSWALGVIALTLVVLATRQEVVASKLKPIIYLESLIATVSHIDKLVTELKNMHEHPDDYGFGTDDTNRMVRGTEAQLTEAARLLDKVGKLVGQLAVVFEMDYQDRTGKTIPHREM